MQKLLDTFSKEIDMIVNNDLKQVVKAVLAEAPDHIATLPSSPTKKFHPPDEHGADGMQIHIRRCIAFAEDAIRQRDYDAGIRDVFIAACMIHDLFKVGLDHEKPLAHTHELHPYWAARAVRKLRDKFPKVANDIDLLAYICLWHEGRWTRATAKQAAMDDGMDIAVSAWNKYAADFHNVDYYASREGVFHCMQPKQPEQQSLL